MLDLIPALPLTGCVNLGKSLDSSGLRSAHPHKGLLEGLKDWKREKHFGQSLVDSKCSINSSCNYY